MTEEEKRRRLQAYALQNFTGQLKVQDTPQAPKVTVAAPQPQQQIRQAQPTQFRAEVTTPYDSRNFLAGQNDRYTSPPKQPTGILGFLNKTYDKVNANTAQDVYKRSLQGQQASYQGGNFGDKLMDMGKSIFQETAKIPENVQQSFTRGNYERAANDIEKALAERDPAKRKQLVLGIADPTGPVLTFGKTRTLDGNLTDEQLAQMLADYRNKQNAPAPKYDTGIKRALYGANNSVESYQQRYRGLKGELQSGTSQAQQILEQKGWNKEADYLKRNAGGVAFPLMGLMAAGDILPVSPSKGKNLIPKKELGKLVKSIDPEEIKNIAITNKINLSDDAAIKIAESTKPKQISSIINNDLKTAAKTPAPEETGVLNTAKTDLATPPVENPTQAIQPEVIKNLTVNKTPEQVKVAVKALYPKLDDVSLEAVSQRIAKSTNDKEVEQTLLEASRRSENVTTAVDEAVAPKVPEQTLEQAVEPQTAPQTIQTPEAPITQTTQPNIPGATTVDNVPNAAPIEKTPQAGTPDPLEALKQEARKYKSADEFARQFEYHGGPKNLKDNKIKLEYDKSGGVFTTPDKRYAQIYKDKTTDGTIHQAYVGDKKIIDLTTPEAVNEVKKLVGSKYTLDGEELVFTKEDLEFLFPNGKADWATFSQYIPLLEKNGYKGARFMEHSDFMGGGELKSTSLFEDTPTLPENFNPTDLYNQATSPKTEGVAPKSAPIEKTPVEQAVPETPPVQAAPTPVETTVQNIVDTNEEIAGKYKQGLFARIKGETSRQWDPRSEANKIDKEYEKTTGKKLNADEKLGEAIRQSGISKNTSIEYIKESPEYNNVVLKYKPNTQAGTEFNFYRVAMLDLERRANGRKPLTDYPTDQLVDQVKQLETKYPDIRNDLISLSQGYVRRLQEKAVYGPDAFISTDDFTNVALKKDGTPYNYYTPIQRVMPEGVARPEVSAKNVGNISRQQVLQDLEKTGNDVDLTYDSLERYSDIVHKQLGQAKVARILGQRVEQGLGGKFIQTADEFARLKAYKQNLQELRDVSKSLDKTIGKLKVKAAYGSRELKQASSQAKTRAKQLLKQSISDDADARAAVDSLSDKDLIDVLKLAAEPDMRKTPNVQRIYNRFAKKNAALARVVEDLDYARMDAEALDSVENGIRSEIAELATDSTTGRQIIRGLDSEGNKFTIEVPPEMAKLVQGIEWKGGNITKAGRFLTAPLRMAWTGVLNPAFIAKSAVWNAAMVPITSPRGFKIYAPSAVKAGFSAVNNSSEFQKMLTRSGANRYGSDFHKLATDSATEAIVGNSSIVNRMKFYNPLTPKGFARSWSRLNEIGGKVDAIYRSAAAKAEYDNVIKSGGTVEQAQKSAAEAYSTVLPDYANVSQQIKAIDAWIPYTAAGEAGTRTFFRAIKNNPKKNAAILGAYTSLGVGVAAYSMSHEQGKQFYEDMEKSGKLTSLDGYAVVVLPGAHKDPESGEWNGVVKIPVPPELKAANRAIRETMAVAATDKNVDPKMYARAMFDFMTGGAFANPKAPVLDIGASLLSGTNVSTGAPIREPNATKAEAAMQSFDYLAGQFGVTGKLAKNFTDSTLEKMGVDMPDKGSGDSYKKILLDSFKNVFYGAKGEKDSQKYFRYRDEALGEVKLNGNQLGVFESVISPRSKDLEGRDIKDKSFYDTSARANAWLKDLSAGDGKLWEVSKRIAQKQKAEGKGIDPLFELEGDQLRTVLNLMANPSPGNKEDKAIQQLNPWVKDFYKKRSNYFDTIFGGEASQDYTGVAIPKADKNLQGQIDALSTMPKETKYQFMKDNPEIADYFASQDAYQRYKRNVMGLPQFDQYPTAPPEVQKAMDAYNSLPKGNGPVGKTTGKPTSPDRSAWIKSHPGEWAAMTEQWYKQNIYNLQGDAALAVYEGIELDKDALANIDSISKYQQQAGGTGSSGYSGYSKFGYSKKGSKSGSSGSDTAEKPAKTYAAQLLSGLPTDFTKTPNIDTTPKKVKFKVKTPSGKGRNYKRIRLQ